MALADGLPLRSNSRSFLDLPTEVRFQIYGLLTPTSRRLWLRQSSFYTPLPVHETLLGSAANLVFRCRYPDQIACLKHWGLGHLRILPGVKEDPGKGNQDNDQGQCVKDHATLLSLRTSNHGISRDVATFLFNTTEMWVDFDAPFLAFLHRVPVLQNLGPSDAPKFAQNSSTIQPVATHLALRAWISMFRQLTFFIHEMRLPALESLQLVFHAGLPNLGFNSQGRMQRSTNTRNLRFIVVGFDEVYYPPAPASPRQGGSGDLPWYMLADQSEEEPKVRTTFKNVRRRGGLEIWRPDLGSLSRQCQWTNDYIYYKIDWDGELTLPASSIGDGYSYEAHGQYIHWTMPVHLRGRGVESRMLAMGFRP